MNRNPRLIRIPLIPERNLPAVTIGEHDGSGAGRYSLDRQQSEEAERCQTKSRDGLQNDHDNIMIGLENAEKLGLRLRGAECGKGAKGVGKGGRVVFRIPALIYGTLDRWRLPPLRPYDG